jgi:hypothetical protein
MNTSLDTRHELQLDGLRYDGEKLVAEVSGLKVSERREVTPDGNFYRVTFLWPVAHLVTEELPAVIAGIVQGDDEGFLRVIKNEPLSATLGVGQEPFEKHTLYALITAHEILVACCMEVPIVEEIHA